VTPKEIVARLNDEIQKFLKSPNIIKRVTDLGGELAAPSTPGAKRQGRSPVSIN